MAASFVRKWLDRLTVVEIAVVDSGDLTLVFSGDAPVGDNLFRMITGVRWGGREWRLSFDSLAGYVAASGRVSVTYRIVSGEVIVATSDTVWSNPEGVTVLCDA